MPSGEVLGLWAVNTSFLIGGVMMFGLLLLYSVFAFMVVRQAALLNSLLETGAASAMKLLAYLHMLLALIVLVISVFYLWQYLP